MTGLSLGEFAAVLTAIGAILGGLLAWSTSQANANAKTHEGRVQDLQKALDDLRADGDERMAELRKDFEWQRQDQARQMTDMKAAMVAQAQTINRQEIMLSDYARHVGKLERIMAAAKLEIPEFETTHFGGQS
ncbi:hypothetical protein [Aureimonas mangrovi]|uniref:hypothetical protein n=1 Tax=Aureimonas mangrovi TaxID=2758041 RepID=UPI00163DD7C7|nr:hypothetical protein [Aureimonas mangrovi]